MQTETSSVTRHYFDWAGTAIPDTALADETVPSGNPSSRHREGRAAKEALENARARCAAVLGVEPSTLYFTSGGTESNCIPLYSNLLRPAGRITASLTEHPSVSENLQTLQRLGKPIAGIPVDTSGRVSPGLLAQTLKKHGDTRFTAIMAVNNETGAINDIKALREILDNCGVPVHFHCDMAQAAGKIPVNLALCDSAAISAHKIGGPRGIGLLYLRRPLEVLYSGGGQERKIRPGTENTSGAAALARCLEKYASASAVNTEYQKAKSRFAKLMRSLAETGRCTFIPSDRNPDSDNFSPYILQAAFRDIPGEVMVRALDDAGIAVSTGSACSSSSPGRPVLKAMGIDEKTSLEGIRISQGWTTTGEEIDFLIQTIIEVIKYL